MASTLEEGKQGRIQEVDLSNLYATLASLHIVLSITASVGNILILVALRKTSSLHPSSKLLYQCLAFSDLFVGTIVQPLCVKMYLDHTESLIRATMSTAHTLAKLIPLLVDVTMFILCGISLTTLVAISIDRLLALRLQLRYRQIVTAKRVLTFIVVLWIFFCGVGPILVIYPILIPWLASSLLTFSVVTSTICYTNIYVILRHHQLQVQSCSDGTLSINIARYRKTVSIALSVCLVLLAFYLPKAVDMFLVLTKSSNSSVTFRYSYNIATLLVVLNSSLNPVVYCWKIREVRQTVKKTLNSLRCL